MDEETLECQQDPSRVNLQNRLTTSESPYQPCPIASNSDKLELEIGDNRIPRFCCGCHKINNIIVAATSQHEEFSNILQVVNSASLRIKNCIVDNAPFRKKKCRLRCVNVTRWSSAFMMLEAVLRAFNRNLISDDESSQDCFPIKLKTIETYYQILIESNEASLDFQKLNSSIGHVIPRNLKIFLIFECYF